MTPGRDRRPWRATLNVKPEEVAEMEMRLAGQDIALEPASDDDEDDLRADRLPVRSRSDEPSQVLEAVQIERVRSEGLVSALEQLDPRSRRIIEARWLAEDDGRRHATLHELADEFGVSAERIRQIEAKALQKMRGLIGEH